MEQRTNMFGGLFGKKSKSGSSEPRKLSNAIASAILGVVGGARAIPSMPGAAQKAFTLATDPNAEARDFVEVIESDEALSARIVRIANSVYFDRGKPSKTIEESVLVIGINELKCLLNSTTLKDIFPTNHPARPQLWGNDIATAIIARQLAQKILPSSSELAFLGGLMHDVGKLLLIQRAPDQYQKVLRMVEERGIDFSEAEQEVFVFDHTEVGQLIAEIWHFSPELIDCIRNHHGVLGTTDIKNPTLPAIVQAADILSHALGLGHPKGFSKLRTSFENRLDQVWNLLQVPAKAHKDQLAEYRKGFEMEYDLYAGKK